MNTSRRHFLQLSAAAGAAAAMGGLASAATSIRGRRMDSKRILILGGTSFLGPAITAAALARGHTVTLFNRGRMEDARDLTFPEGVDVLYGNRDPEKTADDWKKPDSRDPSSPKGLSSLEGKKWDAVIDTSGYYPRIVQASAELLAPNVKQYIFISSISVYAASDTPGADENAAVGTMPDPTVEEMGNQFQNYGPLKALCEQAAEAAMPGRVANVRPGLIVGPGDPTDRWTYWPVRIARGGEVLAPGTPEDPVQFIDVRDLAEWLVRIVETNTNGEFNAIGPEDGMPLGAMLESCKKAAASDATFTWVPADFLQQQNVTPWGDMPNWIPPDAEHAGANRRSVAKAVAAGLTFRPVEVTAKDTLAWWPLEVKRRVAATARMKEEARAAGQPEPNMPDPEQLRAGISADREAAVLAAWHGR